MTKTREAQQHLLRQIPGVDHLLELTKGETFFVSVPKPVLVRSIRAVLAELRGEILNDRQRVTPDMLNDAAVLDRVRRRVSAETMPNLRPLINATGVVIHTNLGRSLLAAEAIDNVAALSASYSNLEFDLSAGKRGLRYSAIEDILCEISGAEAAMAVNNNAAAVLLCLETLSRGREVIVSRGELVEIGGAFRIPDVMAKSGGILREVGTTNRTHFRDYETAIGPETALLLKVHTSNYSVVGFTKAVSVAELVELGRKQGIPVMEDLGSGTFIDFSRCGMTKEPTVQESVTAGADVVTFSGDKLLGGPQAGLIVGKKEMIEKIRKNPLTRALRIDKMTLAALEATLRLYRDPEQAVARIPTLLMLTETPVRIEGRAVRLKSILEKLDDGRLTARILDLGSRVGGGALPLLELPSRCVAVQVDGMSPNAVERHLRTRVRPPVIGRIEDDLFIMDLRTVQEDELPLIESAFRDLLTGNRE